MRVLVTGGSGLVGRYIVDVLAKFIEVEVLDLKPLHRRDIPFLNIDVLDFRRLVPNIKGFDAVVHLAGIPHPLNNPPERVFRVNTMGTFNVLEACALNRIKRFIFMSSESTLGFAFSSQRMWPDYFPVDERHPLRPQDPYGLSKVCGEEMCVSYTRRTGMHTTCLRAPWIWVPEPKEKEIYRKLVADYGSWSKNLWAYVHVLDVAQSVELALRHPYEERHGVYFICADENWTAEESRSLIARYYPETKKIAPTLTGRASLISNALARNELGFAPKYSVRDILG